MTTLGTALIFAGHSERIDSPSDETFLTVRLKSGGAIKRRIHEGKTPVPFNGYRVKAGQFIYSRIDARNGAFAFIPTELDGAVVSKDFPIFNVCDDVVDRRYLHHFFRAGVLEREVKARSFGATNRQRLRETEFLSFPLDLPDLEEQRRIAAILDQADVLRAKRRQALAHLDTLTQSIFHDMFGEISINDGSMLPLRAWLDPGRPLTYGILMPGPHVDGGVPYIRVADLKGGIVNLSTVRSTTHDIANNYKRSTLRAGDLVMSIRGHVGRFASVPAALDGANITQDSARMSITNLATAAYVRAAMESSSIQRWMERRTKGVAVKGINLTDLRDIPIPVASEREITAFASAQSELDRLAATARKSLAEADALFASLQSRAFAGEL